jgi:hypothetical protein
VKGYRNEYLETLPEARVPEQVWNHKQHIIGQTGRGLKPDVSTNNESAAD